MLLSLCSHIGQTSVYSAYANAVLNPDQFYIVVDWSNTPKDLRAELVEEDEQVSAILRWQPAYLALNYTIMRNGVAMGEITEPTFVDSELEAGETYCYQVVAHGEGFEASSNEACVTVPDAPQPPVLPCTAPTGLMRGEYWASITWTAPADRVPDSYTVTVIDHCQHDQTAEIYGITATQYLDMSAPVDVTDRTYKVKAVYEECESEFALTPEGEDFVRITGLDVTENTMLASLYPNPTSDQLTIDMVGMTRVEVYNLVGQCLLHQVVADGTATIDMSSLQNGVYMVKVSAKSGSVMQKVVKM